MVVPPTASVEPQRMAYVSCTPRAARACWSAFPGGYDEVLAANQRSVEEFRAGKDKAFNALVGQAMKATRGKANPQQVSDLLRRKLGG